MLRTSSMLLAVFLCAACESRTVLDDGVVVTGQVGERPSERMVECMQFASKDHCEEEIWGGR